MHPIDYLPWRRTDERKYQVKLRTAARGYDTPLLQNLLKHLYVSILHENPKDTQKEGSTDEDHEDCFQSSKRFASSETRP